MASGHNDDILWLGATRLRGQLIRGFADFFHLTTLGPVIGVSSGLL